MKQIKIITLSIFLGVFNYADGMMSRLNRYIPSYGTKQTKTYKTPIIKSSKKTSSLKKITRSYATENSPNQLSFWQHVKNWISGKWNGKGLSTTAFKIRNKKENSLNDNLM